ncbi:MAG TPA: DUF167 family protein [Chitinophagaceae bacterium]|nr:DUF167 family protein [Chitinophagaceae bacterium]
MIFHAHIKPNAKSDAIVVKENNELQVRISAPPVDGKANKYLIEYLSAVFKVSKASVCILKGQNNPHKMIEIIAEDGYIKNVLSKLKP